MRRQLGNGGPGCKVARNFDPGTCACVNRTTALACSLVKAVRGGLGWAGVATVLGLAVAGTKLSGSMMWFGSVVRDWHVPARWRQVAGRDG